MSAIDLREQDKRILRLHEPTPAVRRLLKSVVQDIETAKHHINERNYGLAEEWLAAAVAKLPAENSVHQLSWPEKEHFTRDRTFGFAGEYQTIYDIEVGGKDHHRFVPTPLNSAEGCGVCFKPPSDPVHHA